MKRALLYLWNLWPPFLGAGIVVDHIARDLSQVRVRLKYRPWTRNMVGSQFGGSIYAMTDPIYMAMFLQRLGRDYIVWDKSAQVRFLKPGRGALTAEFTLSDADISDVRDRLQTQDRLEWQRTVQVTNSAGEVVAEVHKVLHIRRKRSAAPSQSQ